MGQVDKLQSHSGLQIRLLVLHHVEHTAYSMWKYSRGERMSPKTKLAAMTTMFSETHRQYPSCAVNTG